MKRDGGMPGAALSRWIDGALVYGTMASPIVVGVAGAAIDVAVSPAAASRFLVVGILAMVALHIACLARFGRM